MRVSIITCVGPSISRKECSSRIFRGSIGGTGERVTLKLVAQYADACNVFGDPATMAHKFAVLKQHCESVGRDYSSIHRTAWTICSLGETDEQTQEILPERTKALFADSLSSALIGSPETIRSRLAAYEAAGLQELVIRFAEETHLESIRRFGRRVPLEASCAKGAPHHLKVIHSETFRGKDDQHRLSRTR